MKSTPRTRLRRAALALCLACAPCAPPARAQTPAPGAGPAAQAWPRLVATMPDYAGPRRRLYIEALVEFSPDGRLLALSVTRNDVGVFDAATGRRLHTLPSPRDWISAFAFSPDGRTAATRDGTDHTVRIWDMSDGRELRALRSRAGEFETFWKDPDLPATEFFRVPLSPDGRRVLVEREDDVLVMFEAETGREVCALDHHTESNSAKAVLKLVLRGKSRQLHIHAAFSPDGRLVATFNGDASPKLWEAGTCRLVAALDTRGERVYNAAFGRDSRLLATETRKGRLLLWDAGGRPVAALPAREIDYSYWNTAEAYGSPSFALSPDAGAAVTFRDRATELWDAATGRLIRKLPECRSAAFSPDSRLLATSGGGAASARLWDAATGEPVRSLPRAAKKSEHLAFSPDGRTLLTASDAGVILWDVPTGRRLATLEGARFPARFSPDGRRLATGGNAKTAHLYELTRE